MQNENNEFLSLDEVAKILKLPLSSIRLFVRRQDLKARRFGKSYRVSKHDFSEFCKTGVQR